MSTNLRRLGVYGANLPTKKSKIVQASDFAIGGIIGQFERKFDQAFEVQTPEDFKTIFGDHITSTFYGSDAVNGFFDNVSGVDAKLIVVSQVGNTGSAIDAVVADSDVPDGTPEDVLTIEAAYQEELEYGISGNRTGYTVTNGDRFLTACKTANSNTDVFVILDSVSGIRVGDIMKFVGTGGGGATVYKVITIIDESTGKVSFSGAFDGAANMEIADVASVLGFRLRVYRQSLSGIVTEVDEELGKIFCTTESGVTDFFIENVFATSKWVKVTRNTTTPATPDLTLPVDIATVTYLASGADGTAPTTSAHWDFSLALLDDEDVRFIANAESTIETVNKAGETYCQGRTDKPKWLYNIPENQSEAQLKQLGQLYQRSDDVLGVIVANWLKIPDPFSTSTIALDRTIPNVGHVMGAWIRTIETLGIHYVPAVLSVPLRGITGIRGDTFKNAVDRTDIAEAGVNVIQDITGSGIIIKNFFTPSTTTEFQFANGILMREFIKVSAVDSLQSSENTPNSLNRIKEDKMAILFFMRRLWDRGNTGNVPIGETFGQSEDVAGTPTDFDDHVEVIADLTNNPQSRIDLGERNIDIYFTYPTPAGSIKIGVGILLRT